ncbi:MAG: hypothetical protein IH860_03025 [Chloroflexi bacterium]|nr:hypothetical protein [Chloroflexota bacterium]
MSVKTELEQSEGSKKSAQGLNALNIRLNKKVSTQDTEIVSLKANVDSLTDQLVDKSSTNVPKHQVLQRHPWLPVCTGPECSEKNPTWKDETQCKSCKYPLGAVATIDQVDKCPGCGASGEGSAELKHNEEQEE